MFNSEQEQAARKFLHSLLEDAAIYDADGAEALINEEKDNFVYWMMDAFENWNWFAALKFGPAQVKELYTNENVLFDEWVHDTLFDIFCDDLLDLNEELEAWEEMHKDAPTQEEWHDEISDDFERNRG